MNAEQVRMAFRTRDSQAVAAQPQLIIENIRGRAGHSSMNLARNDSASFVRASTAEFASMRMAAVPAGAIASDSTIPCILCIAGLKG